MKTNRIQDLSWVIVQLILLTMLLIAPKVGHLPWLTSLRLPGLLLSLAGLVLSGLAVIQLRSARSLTPLPSPRAESSLITTGWYAHMRHPVYSGLLVWSFGLAIAAASLLHFGLTVLLWIFFTAKAAREEQMLARKFERYSDYQSRTPRFIPRF